MFVKMFFSVQHNEITKQQLLYYACVITGQSIVMKGKKKMRRDALGYFVKACRFVQGLQYSVQTVRFYMAT